jgi:hypothetical protein
MTMMVIRSALFLSLLMASRIGLSADLPAVNGAESNEALVTARTAMANEAAEKWMISVATDMRQSTDSLTRAMGVTGLWIAQQDESSSDAKLLGATLSGEAQALFDSRSTPASALVLLSSVFCSASAQSGPLFCIQDETVDRLRNADPGNAYSIQAAERLALILHPAKVESSKVGEHARANYWGSSRIDVPTILLNSMAVSSRFDDYSMQYKQAVLTAVKSRPVPLEALSEIPPEIYGVLSLFPQEEVVAELAGIGLSAMNIVMEFPASCGKNSVAANTFTSEKKAELKTACDKRQKLILESRQVGAFNLMLGLADLYEKKDVSNSSVRRMMAIEAQLPTIAEPSPSDFLALDWMGLKSVLHIAVTQGDVVAFESGLTWAETQIAKLPKKTAAMMEAEAKERAEYEAEIARDLAATKPTADMATATATDPAAEKSSDGKCMAPAEKPQK